MKRELVVFVKNPVAGKVKTRLAATIGAGKALRIYEHLLEHTVAICREAPQTVSIYFSEEIPEIIPWHDNKFNYYLQEGEHLGQRMEHAFRQAFSRGSREVILIGSDLYDMSSEIIREAFKKLHHSDATLGPAMDGGYYLIGLKNIPEGVFSKKKWGGDTILESTLEDLKRYDVVLLRELNDIDIFDDMKAHPELLQLLNR